MNQVATVTFREPESNEECVAVVRAGGGQVALCLSRRESSDTEVFLPRHLALQVAETLRAGADIA